MLKILIIEHYKKNIKNEKNKNWNSNEDYL